MAPEFKEILIRIDDVEKSLQDLITGNFTEYQKLLTEYTILKPIVQKITLINNQESEIKSLSEMLKLEEVQSEKENYLLWIEELTKKNKDLEAEVHTILNSRRNNKHKENNKRVNENNVTSSDGFKSSKRSKKNFEDSIRRIKKRYWNVVAPGWINTIPVVFEPGQKPDIEIDDLPGFGQLAKEIIIDEESALKNEVLNIVFERKINRITRELFFRNGLFLFHKASHITSAGQIHATKGLQSWALSSSYQGAFLGVKSILYLMGLGIGSYENNSFLIDVWRDTKIEPDENNEITCGFIRFGYRIEHRHIWQLFKRVINSFEIDVWNKKFVAALKKVDIEKFSSQRNSLHYWGNSWIFEDLHEFLVDEDFGVRTEGLESGIELFNEESDFTMILSLMILSLAYDLINDLSQQTNLLKGEKELITNFLKEEQRHPLYQKNFTIK